MKINKNHTEIANIAGFELIEEYDCVYCVDCNPGAPDEPIMFDNSRELTDYMLSKAKEYGIDKKLEARKKAYEDELQKLIEALNEKR